MRMAKIEELNTSLPKIQVLVGPQVIDAAEQARNDVAIRFSKKSRDVKKKEYETSEDILKKHSKAISKMDMQKLFLELEQTELQVERSEDLKTIAGYERDQAEAKLSTYRISGRIKGFVSKIYKKAGEAVRQGDPVMEVNDSSRVKIEGRLPFFELEHVKQGALVIATLPVIKDDNGKKLWEDKEEHRGTVIFIDEKASRTTTPPTTKFKAEFDNPKGKLIPGLMTMLRVYPDIRGPKIPSRKKPAITSIQD